MAQLHQCSVADVTMRVKATDSDGGDTPIITYEAPFEGSYNRMMCFVWSDGLRYMRQIAGAAWTYWGGVPGNATGPSTLAQAFVDGALDVVLRFRLVIDEAGDHTGECYCDGVLVDTWDIEDTVGARTLNVGDLIGELYFGIGGGSATPGQETAHLGPPVATVWRLDQESVWNDFEGDYDNGVWQVVTEHSPVRTAAEGFGGTPQVVATATRLWTDWVPYVQGGGDLSAYRRGGDLFGDGTLVGSGPPARFAPVEVDEDGCVYSAFEAGDTAMGHLEMVFDRYCVGDIYLAITHHPVSNALLVTESGLVGGSTVVGHYKVQRTSLGYDWSERYPFEDAALADLGSDSTSANLVAGDARMDMIHGATARSSRAGHLEGNWQAAVLATGWAPAANYELGAIAEYEGVACSGTDMQFVQAFLEAVWQVSFPAGPSGAWSEHAAAWRTAHLPAGIEYVAETAAANLRPGDAALFAGDSGGIVHSAGTYAHGGAFAALPGGLTGYLRPVLSYPTALAAGERTLLAAVVGDNAYFVRTAPGGGAVANGTSMLGPSEPYPPALALEPVTQRLVAAVQHEDDVVLYVSDDQGGNWTEARTIAGATYFPALWAERGSIWLAAYVGGGSYGGAAGKVKVWRLAATTALEIAAGFPVVAAPSDFGRPGVIRRPLTMELLVVAVKTGASWSDFPAETGVGIAEYRSVDGGASWTPQALHVE